MLKTRSELYRSDRYHRSAVAIPASCPGESTSDMPEQLWFRPRVLVIEFRDEVYAGIKSVLEDHDCLVARAEFGATVAGTLARFKPSLVLINESLPDESGWLAAAKIRVMGYQQPMWLYTVRRPQPPATWMQFSGVSEVIDYGGVLFRLIDHVRQHLARWICYLGSDAEERKSIVTSEVVS